MLLTKRWTAGSTTSDANAKVAVSSAAATKASRESAMSSVETSASVTFRDKATVTVASASASDATTMAKTVAAEAVIDRPASQQAKPAVKASKKKRQKRHQRMVELNSKEPEEAKAYLEAWLSKNEGNADATWKFNKATQAWLLRHIYDPVRVEKDAFRLLLTYIDGLQGAARDRLRMEADAVILLRGAPLAPAEDEPAEASRKRAKKGTNEEVVAETPHPTIEEGDVDAAKETLEKPTGDDISETEVKARKLRLRRAKQVLTAIGTTCETACDAED